MNKYQLLHLLTDCLEAAETDPRLSGSVLRIRMGIVSVSGLATTTQLPPGTVKDYVFKEIKNESIT